MDFADNWNGSGNYKEKVSERTLQMNETQTFEQPYVFGLDIGTRNVVGTVGYKEMNLSLWHSMSCSMRQGR